MRGLAAYAVVYPAAMRFLNEFWTSLAPQVGSGVDVHISLDGVTPNDVLAVIGSKAAVRFWPADEGMSPARIRSTVLAELTSAYDGVVLLDSDDMLLPGRIAAAAAGLEVADVYASAMRLVDESGDPIPGGFFAPSPAQIAQLDSAQPLLARINVFGFSNSAYRSQVLRDCLPVPCSTVLMDWLVASRAYLAGARFMFDHEPRMLYRQYGTNTAGVLPPFGPARIKRDAALVAQHHSLLLQGPYASARDPQPFVQAARLSGEFLHWLDTGRTDEARASAYAARLSTARPRGWLWWEHVAAVADEQGFRPSVL